MSERLHIIVTGDCLSTSSFQLSKKNLWLVGTVIVIGFFSTILFGYLTTGSYVKAKVQARTIASLQHRLKLSKKASTDLLRTLEANREKHEAALAQQKMAYDLENSNLRLENTRLIATAVNDLNKRSELIESVMSTIGVKIDDQKNSADETANSGGPYIPDMDASFDELMKKTDEYLQVIRLVPLGKPVPGPISSGFGRRADPINHKKAIHEGVDLRGKRGEKIYATASGTVIKAFKNGGYGNYVEIDHGNGYHTVYGHMQSYLVKKGEFIKQGQLIGLVGSSGRSTGPHLHYEILLNNRPIDPVKFMNIADISHTFTNTQE